MKKSRYPKKDALSAWLNDGKFVVPQDFQTSVEYLKRVVIETWMPLEKDQAIGTELFLSDFTCLFGSDWLVGPVIDHVIECFTGGQMEDTLFGFLRETAEMATRDVTIFERHTVNSAAVTTLILPFFVNNNHFTVVSIDSIEKNTTG